MKPINSSYILWLPSWYPNKLQPYTGDFIQRHAQAVALFERVVVIHILRDKDGIITKNVKEEIINSETLTEHIIYYYIPPLRWKLFEKAISYKKYISLYKNKINTIIKQNDKPLLTHIHITYKAGLIALWLKKKFKISYIITEHSSIFLKEAKKKFKNLPLYYKILFNKIWSGSDSMSVVSCYLKKQFITLNYTKPLYIIPNVVNTTIFKPAYKKKESVVNNFIHISSLEHSKNPEQIIEAFAILKKTHSNFTLDIIGPINKKLQQLVANLHLQQQVFFKPEMPQNELVHLIQQSDALILFSRYETFGCVLIEANACGKPVIVSDIPVIRENIKEGVNGIFAVNEDVADLAKKLTLFIEGHYNFDSSKIASETIEKYNYNVVGKQFSDWYKQIAKDKTLSSS